MKTRSYHLLNMLYYHAMPTKDWELLRRPGIPVEVITGQVEDHLLKALFICRRFKWLSIDIQQNMNVKTLKVLWILDCILIGLNVPGLDLNPWHRKRWNSTLFTLKKTKVALDWFPWTNYSYTMPQFIPIINDGDPQHATLVDWMWHLYPHCPWQMILLMMASTRLFKLNFEQ